MTEPTSDPSPAPPLPAAPHAVVPLSYLTPPGLDHNRPTGGLWRDGNRLVVARDAVGPDVCVKCNAPADGNRWRKNLTWINPLFALLILVGVLVYVIVYFAVRKTMAVNLGMCRRHQKRYWLFYSLGLALMLVIPLVILVVGVSANLPGSFFLSIVASVIGGIVLLVLAQRHTLRVTKIDERFAWLKAASPEFLQTLPSSTP